MAITEWRTDMRTEWQPASLTHRKVGSSGSGRWDQRRNKEGAREPAKHVSEADMAKAYNRPGTAKQRQRRPDEGEEGKKTPKIYVEDKGKDREKSRRNGL